MKQSAVGLSLCLLSVFAATAATAQSVDSTLPTRAQVVREWSAGIRSNADKAATTINRDAIKAGLKPAALKLEMPALSDSSELGEPVVMVTRRQANRPSAD